MYSAFKNFLWTLLNNPLSRSGKIMNFIILTLIIASLVSIPFYFIEIGPSFAFEILEIGAFIIFMLEYLSRIWSIPKVQKKFKYIFSWWGTIDFIALIPFILSFSGLIQNGYIDMSIRLILLLKLIKTYEHIRIVEAMNSSDKHGHFTTLPEEKIERVVQKHPVIFLVALVIPLMFLSLSLSLFLLFGDNGIVLGLSAFFCFLSFVFFLKAWLDFQYDVIYITNTRIVIQQRELFGVEIDYIPYEFITNIKPSSLDIFTYLIGAGHIAIETAAEKGNKDFRHTKNHHRIVEHISQNRAKALKSTNNQSTPLVGNN